MRIRQEVPTVGAKVGFKETDLFGYGRLGEALANMVERLEGPGVFVLNGSWGSGKSVFARQWAELLRGRDIAVIEFDALQSDHGDDPFLLLAGAVREFADSQELPQGSNGLTEKAQRLGKALLPIATTLSVKLASGGILSPEDFSLKADELLRERIVGAGKARKAAAEFKKSLEALAEQLLTKGTADDANAGRTGTTGLVIIVDELDRCRPTYALWLLERIRHLFSVSGVCFLVVTDLRQLEQVAMKEYGIRSDDARVFLRKYYDMDFLLRGPMVLDPHMRKIHSDRSAYIDKLWRESRFSEQKDQWGDWSVESLKMLADAHELDLRTIEHVVAEMRLFALTVSPNEKYWSYVLIGLCVMRVVEPDSFRRAATGSLALVDAQKFHKSAWWNGKHVDIEYSNIIVPYTAMWHLAVAKSEEEFPQSGEVARWIKNLTSAVWNLQMPLGMIERICRHLDQVVHDA